MLILLYLTGVAVCFSLVMAYSLRQVAKGNFKRHNAKIIIPLALMSWLGVITFVVLHIYFRRIYPPK